MTLYLSISFGKMAGIDAGVASLQWSEATLAPGTKPAKLQIGT